MPLYERKLAQGPEALLRVGLCVIRHRKTVCLDLNFTCLHLNISDRFGDIVKRGHILTGGIDHLIGRLALHSANVCQRGIKGYLQAVTRCKRSYDHLITLARQRRTVIDLRCILDRNGNRTASGIDISTHRADLIARGNIDTVFVVNQNRCDLRMAAIGIIGKGCARQAVGVNQIRRGNRRLRAVMHARLADRDQNRLLLDGKGLGLTVAITEGRLCHGANLILARHERDVLRPRIAAKRRVFVFHVAHKRFCFILEDLSVEDLHQLIALTRRDRTLGDKQTNGRRHNQSEHSNDFSKMSKYELKKRFYFLNF